MTQSTHVGEAFAVNASMGSGQQAKRTRRSKKRKGLTLQRLFTRPGEDPLADVVWERRQSMITNPDGSVVFKMEGAEIPAEWSQLATDIVVSKYFRKAGLYGDKNQSETSVRQVVYRIAHAIRTAGEQAGGYFATRKDGETFEAELIYLLANQYGAFNSPVWFNCGLFHEYGITGSRGNWAWDAQAQAILETEDAYSRPQCSACFIQKVDDDLMSIYDLIKHEARLFKYGSGTGTNFSAIRGKQEKLSSGGTSSGLMSFLEVFDRAAGATKSGGTTRRAAKMVTLDMDHPEIVDFITWKAREEKKAQLLIGAGLDSDFNGEAYRTVSGQNSNNSVRVTDDFMKAALSGSKWQTRQRTTGEIADTFDASELWRMIADAAWSCADPGIQYDTTINRWHTCPNSGRINASNPCSEFMFVDDSACNLASLNLTRFLNSNGELNLETFDHAVRVFLIAQEILVDFSSYPTRQIAQNSHDFRPLGLGYANLGTLLMLKGVPYDSDQGRSMAGAITALMCGHAYGVSAQMAASKGPFARFPENREPMLRVMRMHQEAAYALNRDECPEYLWRAACEAWDSAVELGEQHGYRNSQTTVLAPTGTIGLLMDCDTTGIEPDFSLVKFKKLAGGGYFKIVNQSVPQALTQLGYSEAQTQEIVAYVSGTNTLLGAPHINRSSLRECGLEDDVLDRIEDAIPGVFDLSLAFAPWVLGKETYDQLGVDADRLSQPGFSLLRHLGYTENQIAEANEHIVGRMTVEGAPHLEKAHYAVFDCANRCGATGTRYLTPMAHVRMMAAVQPFLSGAISKTVNLPNEAAVDDIGEIYEEAWKLGLKAIALYRDGCKASQPLSSRGGTSKSEEAEPEDETVASEAPVAPRRQPSVPPVSVHPEGRRVRLPKKRSGFTQEALVGGHKVFLRTGEYEDGTLGEIFIDMHKEGAAFRSLMNCFAMAVSVGLQYGVPLETFVDQFTFTRFEPHGVVSGHPNIKFATSIVDYLFRVLGVEYLQRYDFAQVKPALAPTPIEDPTGPNLVPASIPPDDSRATLLPGARPDPAVKEAGSEAGGTEKANAEGDIHGALNAQLEELMGDAPVCDGCGHITVRNGACYKCLNCGNSMGCS